jgi:hypothetical protein
VHDRAAAHDASSRTQPQQVANVVPTVRQSGSTEQARHAQDGHATAVETAANDRKHHTLALLRCALPTYYEAEAEASEALLLVV